jgi:hypothetical protein
VPGLAGREPAARERAINQALKAADEVAVALQAHLTEEPQADPERAAAHSPSPTRSSSCGTLASVSAKGLEAVEADGIAEPDEISLRNP